MKLSPREFFEKEVPQKLIDRPDFVKKINSIYQFDITGDEGGSWVVDLTKPEVREGKDEDARCMVSASDEDFIQVITGGISPQMAFMSGKLKVGGDMTLAMRLTEILV